MHAEGLSNPALIVALALAAGTFCQSLARHLRVPGIVLLLIAGVLLGPDGLGVIDPRGLGEGLPLIVGFAVAVILFEGGLNLEWKRLRRQAKVIRRLIGPGALLTTAGGALAAHFLLLWDWRLSILFGTLVIVTGPTVVTPLLRRVKVLRRLETVLEAEGILIDAVGAIIAVVTLEIVVSPSGESAALGMVSVPSRLVAGTAMGAAGGLLLALLLRFRHVIPEGLENVFTLSMALAIYQASNAILPESGIAAAIAAGLVVGNMRTARVRELRDFKEQLTLMLIGLLFVLLAADVRVADVRALGWPGLWVVALLVFVVRPAQVYLCTIGAGMGARERAFLSWVAPRGIIAAAISSLFAERLAHHGVDGGTELRALVFLVIAVTVVIQGATVGPVARLLGVRRPAGKGYAILGASPLSRSIARLLEDAGEEVVLYDANADNCSETEREGFRVFFGNALDEGRLARTELDTRKAALGMSPNEGINLLFACKAREEFGVPQGYVSIQKGHASLTVEMVREAGCHALFAAPADLELWSVRLRRKVARVETRVFAPPANAPKDLGATCLRTGESAGNMLLALMNFRDGKPRPIDASVEIRPGDRVAWLIFTERREEAEAWLEDQGFTS
jgi:NhaP-type Na+/H+ or K+/H+ antiporter